MTDERLLKDASRGDEAAFLVLYQRHRDAVFRFAYRLTGSTSAAEDVTHDCFLSLIRAPERFDPSRAQLRTYLFAAARNLSFKHLRPKGEQLALDELTVEPSGPDADQPLGRLLKEELSAEVQKAVTSLPPLQREALVLFEYEELSLAEIALVTGTETGVVKSRLHRARVTLRQLLAPYLQGSVRRAVAAPEVL
jgi:RNA polymerase sigma-70 factor (ECF subfamily)